MTTKRTALVLGATGGIGGEMARALRRRGWRCAPCTAGLGQWRSATGSTGARATGWRRRTWLARAEGVELIVHTVNPPGYRNWGRLVLPMLESSIAASRATGARIVLPGTVSNFGPGTLPLIAEASPQNPVMRKGRIRVEMSGASPPPASRC